MADSNENANQRGTTTIADTVVAKTAGVAAREVSGVHALGGTASQAIGAVRRRVGRTPLTQGVSVEVGQTQTAIDLSMEVDYGQAIHRVAQRVRDRVISAVEGATGLQVTEVNITVTDCHVEGVDEEAGGEGEQGEGGGSSSRRSLQ